ncbi:MAG: RHS repeat-associated core domain-containing protein [Pseudomonadota bacterium]
MLSTHQTLITPKIHSASTLSKAFAAMGLMLFSHFIYALSITMPTADTDGTYNISWSGGLAYVTLYENIGGVWTKKTDSGGGSTVNTFNVTGKTVGEYSYKFVDCQISGGQGGTTTTCTDTFRAVKVLSPPSPVSLSLNRSSGIASVSWTAVSGSAWYEIQPKLNSSNFGSAVTISGSSSATFPQIPVASSVGSYSYAVRACIGTNDCTAFAESPAAAMPRASTPTIKSTLPDSNRNYVIQWNPVANVTSYTLNQNGVDIAVGLTTSYPVSGKANGLYTYKLKANNVTGSSSDSNSLNLPVSNTQLRPLAETLNNTNYDFYVGDFNNDGIRDYYFHSKAALSPQLSFIVFGLASPDYTAPIATRLSDSTLANLLSTGYLRVATSIETAHVTSRVGTFPTNSEFNFQTQAPDSFKYSLSYSAAPSLGASQNVATTQGDISVANGAAKYSVKIDLPPAVRDLKPSLSLSYNSRSGNGLMGVGWNLGGISAITRCNATFATDGYSGGNDRLCLDGQKLVVANGSTNYWATNTIYKTEIDNFSKIQVLGATGNLFKDMYFKVWTKDGRILTYGGQDSAQNSRLSKDFNAVDTWALDKVEDAYGNSYTITYQRNTQDNDYYPDRINFGPESAVVFKYQTRSGQTPWGYENGAKYKKTKVLDTVTTYINVTSPTAPETGTPVKRYDVNYKLSGGTQRELVDTISECGYESSTWKCARPLTFAWQAGELGFDEATPHQITYCTGGDVSGVVQFIDLDGDGYNDALQKKGIAWGTQNNCFTNGSWVTSGYTPDIVQPIKTRSGYALVIKQTNSSVTPNIRTVGVLYNINKSAQTKSYIEIARDTTQTGGVITSDLQGDGLDDFIYNKKSFTQQDSAVPTFTAVTRTTYDTDKFKVGAMLLDMDGDGYKEEIATSVNYGAATQDMPAGVYINVGGFPNGNGTWSFEANQTKLVAAGQSYYSQPIMIAGGIYRTMADINGDGNKDFIFNHINKDASSANYGKGEWLYRLNLQNGDVGPEINTSIVSNGSGVHPTNHYSYSYDYDKDGREDLLAVIPGSGADNCQLRVLLARDISGEMNFQESSGVVLRFLSGTACTPVAGENQDNVFVGDMNNDGVQDVKYLNNVFYGKPKQSDLMVKITDGFGADIILDYSPLTGETNNDRPLYTPDSSAPSYPQASPGRGMQVVKKLSVNNAKGGYNERFYNYTGAKMDLQGRGFLGFANIQVTDKASDIVTSTDYRQGFPYTGRVDTATSKTSAGNLISSTKNAYAIHAQNPRFPYLDYTLQKSYQLLTTDLNSPLSATRVQNVYDSCGTMTEQIAETGTGVNSATITGVLSRGRTVNNVDYFSTADCSDDFVNLTTKEASKTSASDDLRTTITEYQPNTAREVGTIIAFKGTALQKTTVISRATNGVVIGTSETAADIDGGTAATRATTSTDLAKGMFPQTITNTVSSGDHVTIVGYDYRFGLENSIRTPDLQTTTLTYDYLGRQVGSLAADGTRTELISFYCSSAPMSCSGYYAVATKVTNTALPGVLGEPITVVFYDQLQREVQRSTYSLAGKRINISTKYRADGRLESISEPYVDLYNGTSTSLWTNFTNYDALGRAHTVVDADGGTKTTLHEKYGDKVKVTDTVTVVGPRSTSTQTTQRYINPLGQVAQVIDAIGTPVDYSYNSKGHLATTKVNNNSATLVSIDYDDQGNKSRIVDPDAGKIDFNYNGFGELRRQIWQKDVANVTKSITFTYDQLGRQLTRVDQKPTGSKTDYVWEWDTKQKGRLSKETGNNKGMTYGYDGFSRLTSASTAISGLPDRKFVYGYDNFSRPTDTTYPNGFKTTRQYHAAGFAAQTSDISDSANPKMLWALGNDLDTRGNFSHQLWGNGVVTQTSFDNKNGRIKSINSGRLTSASLSNLNRDVQALGYEYDTLGNLQTRTSQRTNTAGTALENLREEFVYDGLNRLKTSTTSGLFSRTNDYTYDELGNLKTRTSKQGTSTVNDDIGTLTYDRTNNAGVHAVSSAGGLTYQYDKYGNMTKRGNETIEYNVFNKPVRITGTTTTVFDYDANHELFRETAGSAITYRFEGGLYEEIVEGTKTTQKSYVDGVILNTRTLNSGVLASNDTVYLHSDNLGSIEATSSKLGQFVNRMSFSDWGKRQQSDWKTGSPTDVFATADGYTGHHQLDQHKLVHMGGRVYDPGLGRFLSADLVVQSPYSSQSFNRYSYVFNNPLSNVDPTGYSCTATTNTMWGRTVGVSDWSVIDSSTSTSGDCGWNQMPMWTGADDFYDQQNIYNKLAPLDPPDISEKQGPAAQPSISNYCYDQQYGGSCAKFTQEEYQQQFETINPAQGLVDCTLKGCGGAGWTWGAMGVVPVFKLEGQALTWGKNAMGHLIKHADVVGYGHLSPQELQKMMPELKNAVQSLLLSADTSLTKIGNWNETKNAIMYISEGKMIVTKESGEFITMINKTSNRWYENAVGLFQ